MYGVCSLMVLCSSLRVLPRWQSPDWEATRTDHAVAADRGRHGREAGPQARTCCHQARLMNGSNMSPDGRTENDVPVARERDSRIDRPLPLRRFVVPPKLPPPISPALVEHAEERARDVQNRAADAITRFAGSMTFVYLHIIWFGCWIGFGVESYPYGLLTMIVSLEAIFLSTFVMISQNLSLIHI